MADSATILLVDDEDAVQKLLTYPLERDGYRVVPALDGEEALAQFERERVDLVELGADDYITKPFSIREFRSRVRALLRRAAVSPAAKDDAERLGVSGLVVDLTRRTVEVDGLSAELTYVEFEILRAMAAHPGRVYTRRALLEAVWGDADYRDPRTVDVHVRHLREKLERDPRKPELILTVRGVGYRLREG